MSNKRGAGLKGPNPVCRIGERVYLVAGLSAEAFDARFGRFVKRDIELVADERPFFAVQTLNAIDEQAFDSEWLLVDFDGFASQAGLDVAASGKLLMAIVRLVAQSFGLRRDAVLRNMIETILATNGLPRGKAVVHSVENFDTAICEVPTRLRLARGSLMVSFVDQLVLGGVRAVEPILGDDGGRKLAAVDCSSALPKGRALVITPRGIAVADIDNRPNDDIRQFNATLALTLPDAVNLLAIWDDEARAALAAIGRREKSLPTVALKSQGFRFEVTYAFSLAHGLFVSGWLLDPDDILEEILVVDHGLAEKSLTDQWLRVPARAEVDGETIPVSRFHAFFARQEGVAAPSNIAFRLRLRNGESHLAYVADCSPDKRAARAGILDSVVGAAMSEDMLAQVFAPAIERIQAACNAEQRVREVIDIGSASSRRISLIIPLYREMRFMRSQLIAFNADPFVQAHCQIVYVVDDPLIAQRVRNMLSGTPNVFSLDIRLVLLERNGGYALANNFGVQEAAGEVLVLMNSDVTPERPGWLEPMAERLAQLPARSVIGPKLLYADQSLQHAGMYFFRLPTIGYWQNMHFFKGYGRDFPPANVERDVPAVTGAVMMIRREDFQAVGGFTSDYVIGDYEDSDLCLKLRAEGGRCLYMPSVALLHFERQSMPDSDIDAGSTIYNRALHSARWSQTIDALMADASEVRHAV